MRILLTNILYWSPWTNFLAEDIFFQLFFSFFFIFFAYSSNLYYKLLYFFALIVWIGVCLSYLDHELLTGFLWAVELSVIFILILFLFFFNYSGNIIKLQRFSFLISAVIGFFFLFDNSIQTTSLFFLLDFFEEDWYEASHNTATNDLSSIFASLYIFNSFCLIMVGFLIFLITCLSVQLLKQSTHTTSGSYKYLDQKYQLLSDLLNFEFFRKQNLVYQNLNKPSARFKSSSSQNGSKRK